MNFEKIIVIFIFLAILAGGSIAQIYLNFKWTKSLNRIKFAKNLKSPRQGSIKE